MLSHRSSPVLYPEIIPSADQLAELKREIGNVLDPKNPVKTLSYNVILLSGNKCVKWGSQVYEREAMAMEYIRRNTSIPVPTVHWFFKDENGFGYLVMDYVDSGTLLQCVELDIPASQRENIIVQINDFIQQLRRLGGNSCKSMGSWQAQDPSQPIAYDNVFYRRLNELQPSAPFTSMQALRDHWLLRWSKRKTLGPSPQISIDQIPDTVVLTHGDFGAHNILVRDGSIVAVLDWDSIGWYPSFWEYAFSRRGSFHSSWQETFDEVFGQMPLPETNFFNFIDRAFSTDDD